MESPVVVDKPPEYHGSDRGFPFEEEEGSGAWSELAARHPDIAARLRQRPATWARKRRPSSHDATDDFGDSFGGFDRFPFDDIPPEFREHFPSHWNRRYGPRDETQHTPQQSPPTPHHSTTATQTEQGTDPEPDQQTSIPQYGLRNTVDLGQKSAADPSLVDADERTHRSMSAPPDTPNQNKMSGQNHHEQAHQPPHAEQSSNVRHIPIFVEGRDEPVINKNVDHGTHFGDSKPTYVPPPQQPHIDRDQYFADDGPTFHPPPNFSRAFGTPFNKGFRQGPQPFVQQKVYPQTAFARGASPQRSQSPKPQMHPEEHFVKVPVHHDQPAQKTEPPSRAQKSPQQHQPPPQHPQQPHAQHHPQPPHPQQQQHVPPHQPPPQREQTPPQPKPQAPSSNDPITQILSIQTDVLNLMTEVENFTGSKNDKKYLFLDEMLTRNLIKLDNIETDGKENIRQARKEAIKCIQKCIAVLEAKAESNKAEKAANAAQAQAQAQAQAEEQPEEQPQTQDVEMKENAEKVAESTAAPEQVAENGEVEMKESTKEEIPPQVEPQSDKEKTPVPAAVAQEDNKEEPKPPEEKIEVPKDQEAAPAETKEVPEAQAADTRPEDNKTTEEKTETKLEEQKVDEKDKKPSPKKGNKAARKRDKSKDKTADTPKDSNKEENVDQADKKSEEQKEDKVESMQVDDKGDKRDSQVMDVDGAASQ